MNYRPKLLISILFTLTAASFPNENEPAERYVFLTGHGSVVQAVDYSPNGKYLATGSWDGEINIYSLDSGAKLAQTLYGHEAVVTRLEFSRDSKKLISGGNDYKVITWKYTDDWVGFEPDKESRPHSQPVSGVAYGPGMKMTFSSSADGKIIVNNLANNKERVIDHKKMINGMAVSSNRQFLYVADQGTIIQEYDMLGNAKRKFEGHVGEVLALAYAPNRQFLLSGSTDKTAIVWDLNKGKVKHVLKKHSWKVNAVDISSDSKYGVTGGKDGFCYLWELNKGDLIDSMHIQGSDITSVSFNYDNQYIAIGARLKDREVEDFGAIIWKTGLPSRFAKPKRPEGAAPGTPGQKTDPRAKPPVKPASTKQE